MRRVSKCMYCIPVPSNARNKKCTLFDVQVVHHDLSYNEPITVVQPREVFNQQSFAQALQILSSATCISKITPVTVQWNSRDKTNVHGYIDFELNIISSINR